MQKLNDKIALITGGTTGIGLATARLFAAEGAKVIITGQSDERLAAAEKELGGGVWAIKADAASLADTDRLVQAIRERHGRIDVLFVNAGVGKFLPLEMVNEAFYDEVMNINLKGAFFTVQKALPLLAKGASIIFTGSVLGEYGIASASVYSATKAALASLAQTLSAELAGRGIRINTLSPGPVATPLWGKMGMPAEAASGMLEAVKSSVPMKRLGEPEEIARAALFLASDDSSFMMGGNVKVGGGYGDMAPQ